MAESNLPIKISKTTTSQVPEENTEDNIYDEIPIDITVKEKTATNIDKVLRFINGLLNTDGGEIKLVNIKYDRAEPKNFDIWLGKLENALDVPTSSKYLKWNCDSEDLEFRTPGKQLYNTKKLYLRVKPKTDELNTIKTYLYMPRMTVVVPVNVEDAFKILNNADFSHTLRALPPYSKNFVYGEVHHDARNESDTIQFKEINEKVSNIPKRISNDAERYLSAFCNHNGGRIIFGIKDESSKVVGVKLTEKNKKEIEETMVKKMEGFLYGYTKKPVRKDHWDIEFHNVAQPEGLMEEGKTLEVIVVSVSKFPGGVFTASPAAYYVDVNDGCIKQYGFEAWIKEIQERRRNANLCDRLVFQEVRSHPQYNNPGVKPTNVKYPSAIYKMDDESRKLFAEALKEGLEVKREIRVIVVGKKAAGKTSLIKRLLSKSISDVTSTNGVDIYSVACEDETQFGDSWGEKLPTAADSRLLVGTIQTEKKLKEQFKNVDKVTTKDKRCTDPQQLECALRESLKQHERESNGIATVEDRLRRNCNRMGLRFKDLTPRNGNCFFEAVTSQLVQLGLDKKTPDQLRKDVVEFLTENKTFEAEDGLVNIEYFMDADFDEWCSSMRNNGVFADHVTVMGTAKMLQNDIMIVTSSPAGGVDQNVTWVVGKKEFTGHPILLGHYWENHYQSLELKTENDTGSSMTFLEEGKEIPTSDEDIEVMETNYKKENIQSVEMLPDRNSAKYLKVATTNRKDGIDTHLAEMTNAEMINENEVRIAIWDFGGDEEFYYTHPVFLAHDVVFLIVTSLADTDNKSLGEFKFWFNTIHCLCYDREDSKELNPPCIVVGTHIDQCESEDTAAELLFDKLEAVGNLSRHVVGEPFFISNTEDSEENNQTLKKIQMAIAEAAKKSRDWKTIHPLKFILLDKALETEKRVNENKPTVAFDDIKRINTSLTNPLTDKELELYLQYNCAMGHLIYNEDIPNYIVIKPQWLSDVFRCIVTADKFWIKLPKYMSDWKQLRETGKVTENLLHAVFEKIAVEKEHETYLTKIMVKFHIMIRLPCKEGDTLNNSYFAPCMIKGKKLPPLSHLYEAKGMTKSTCLCIEFDFLPPFLFNHMMIMFCDKYVHTDQTEDSPRFFTDAAIFTISSSGCVKLVLVRHKDIVQLQVLMFGATDLKLYCEIKTFVEENIKKIIKNMGLQIKYYVRWKCQDTDYACDKLIAEERSFCEEHNCRHERENDWVNSSSAQHPAKEAKDESTLTEKELNFTRLSMLVMNVLANALYDLPPLPKPKARDECDITFLYRMHRGEREIYSKTPSLGKWGHVDELSDIPTEFIKVEDDIERCRLIRNRLNHSSFCEIENSEIDDTYKVIIQILTRLYKCMGLTSTPTYMDNAEEIKRKTYKVPDMKRIKDLLEKEGNVTYIAEKIEIHHHHHY